MTSDEQLYAVIAAGLAIIVVLWLLAKLWKPLLAIAALGVIGAVGVCTLNPTRCPFGQLNLPGGISPGGQNTTVLIRPGQQDARPDFVIIGARQESPNRSAPSGRQNYLTVQVSNEGNAGYSGWIVVQGPGNAQGGIQGLRPGEAKATAVSILAVGTPGLTTTNVYLRVDPDNVVTEWNESNNSFGPVPVTIY